MDNIIVFFKKLDNFDDNLGLPKYETEYSAGMDVRAMLSSKESILVGPGETVLLNTGFALEISPGYELQLRSRSGLSLKNGLIVKNSPATIDSDFRSEIKIILYNISDTPQTINHGDRVAQMVFNKVPRATFIVKEELSSSNRKGGFGSTGIN